METNNFKEQGNTPEKKNYVVEKPLYTCSLWAGRRRYYFDVLSTKGGDKYISITETRKKYDDNGVAFFDNQKIFLFKEDFTKFTNGLMQALEFIDNANYNQLEQKEEI